MKGTTVLKKFCLLDHDLKYITSPSPPLPITSQQEQTIFPPDPKLEHMLLARNSLAELVYVDGVSGVWPGIVGVQSKVCGFVYKFWKASWSLSVLRSVRAEMRIGDGRSVDGEWCGN